MSNWLGAEFPRGEKGLILSSNDLWDGGPHRSPFSVVEGPRNGRLLLSVFGDLKDVEAGSRCW